MSLPSQEGELGTGEEQIEDLDSSSVCPTPSPSLATSPRSRFATSADCRPETMSRMSRRNRTISRLASARWNESRRLVRDELASQQQPLSSPAFFATAATAAAAAAAGVEMKTAALMKSQFRLGSGRWWVWVWGGGQGCSQWEALRHVGAMLRKGVGALLAIQKRNHTTVSVD